MQYQANWGHETWRGEDSRKPNGKRFASICGSRDLSRWVDALVWWIGAVLRASFGLSVWAPNGVSCRGDMAAPAPLAAAQTLAGLLGPAQ